MAGIQLTPEGWSGSTRGIWNRRANVVIDRKSGIEVVGRKLINALGGNDVITGEQESGVGVFVPSKPRRGNLQLGDGDDSLTGTSKQGVGIENRGFIFTGPGNDSIIGSGGKSGIRNRGYIFTQGGNDSVDAREGGIRGGGFIDLSAGSDTFIGFGNHVVYGGGGRDTLLLPAGSYDVAKRNKNRYRLEKGDDRLEIFDFEVVGGINSKRSQRIEIDNGGTLVVKTDGSISLT
jgi:hypothetical protein